MLLSAKPVAHDILVSCHNYVTVTRAKCICQCMLAEKKLVDTSQCLMLT